MRIVEIANAEEQLALWKLVNDNVWQAIETQRQQQAQAAWRAAAKGVQGRVQLPMAVLPSAGFASQTQTAGQDLGALRIGLQSTAMHGSR